MSEDWRDEILGEASGGPKAKGIATHDTTGRRIKGRSKATKPKNWRKKKRKARKRARASQRRNRR